MGADPRAALLRWATDVENEARAADAVDPGPWHRNEQDMVISADDSEVAWDIAWETARHIARHDTSSVLAQVAAIRAVVELHRRVPAGGLIGTCAHCDWKWTCPTLLELADGFVPGWRDLD